MVMLLFYIVRLSPNRARKYGGQWNLCASPIMVASRIVLYYSLALQILYPKSEGKDSPCNSH